VTSFFCASIVTLLARVPCFHCRTDKESDDVYDEVERRTRWSRKIERRLQRTNRPVLYNENDGCDATHARYCGVEQRRRRAAYCCYLGSRQRDPPTIRLSGLCRIATLQCNAKQVNSLHDYACYTESSTPHSCQRQIVEEGISIQSATQNALFPESRPINQATPPSDCHSDRRKAIHPQHSKIARQALPSSHTSSR
jgi:hypothetical protein